MKKKLFVWAVLCLTIDFVYGETHHCCPDNGVIHKARCPNGEKTMVSTLCNSTGAFIMQPDDESGFDMFEIQEDDSLLMSSSTISIPKDSFCLGKLSVNNEAKDIALVCFKDKEDEQRIGISFVATSICCITSIIFLLSTLLVYIILPDLRDLQGKCLMLSVFSLLLALIFLTIVQNKTSFGVSACVTIASLIYFWFLCVFFWLNIVSFNVWRSVVRPKWFVARNSIFYCYNIYAWGMPFLCLVITLICHHTPGSHIKPNFGITNCWFRDKAEMWVYFYGPISVLLFLNIVMFVSTAWTLWRNVQYYKEQKLRSQRFKFLLYLKLFIIMGLCWTFEPLSNVFESSYWIVTDYINALQGVLIFLLLVVFRKRVRRGLARKGLCCLKLPQTWATMKDEECEELEEGVEEASSINVNTMNDT